MLCLVNLEFTKHSPHSKFAIKDLEESDLFCNFATAVTVTAVAIL